MVIMVLIPGLATINPVAASSLVGFGEPPDWNTDFSIIDFHGKSDDTIPYDYDGSFGIGPHDSLVSYDGYFYDDKRSLLTKWSDKLNCILEVIKNIIRNAIIHGIIYRRCPTIRIMMARRDLVAGKDFAKIKSPSCIASDFTVTIIRFRESSMQQPKWHGIS